MLATMGAIYVEESRMNLLYQDLGFYNFCAKYLAIQIKMWICY